MVYKYKWPDWINNIDYDRLNKNNNKSVDYSDTVWMTASKIIRLES